MKLHRNPKYAKIGRLPWRHLNVRALRHDLEIQVVLGQEICVSTAEFAKVVNFGVKTKTRSTNVEVSSRNCTNFCIR